MGFLGWKFYKCIFIYQPQPHPGCHQLWCHQWWCQPQPGPPQPQPPPPQANARWDSTAIDTRLAAVTTAKITSTDAIIDVFFGIVTNLTHHEYGLIPYYVILYRIFYNFICCFFTLRVINTNPNITYINIAIQ